MTNKPTTMTLAEKIDEVLDGVYGLKTQTYKSGATVIKLRDDGATTRSEAKKAILTLIKEAEREARADMTDRIINEIDYLELNSSHTDEHWRFCKDVRNTIRAEFEKVYGFDPSPNNTGNRIKALSDKKGKE